MAAHPRRQAGLGEHTLQRTRDAGRVLPLDQEPRAAAEKLDGMRETGRHHRLTGGDRLDQDPGGHLFRESYGSRTTSAELMT